MAETPNGMIGVWQSCKTGCQSSRWDRRDVQNAQSSLGGAIRPSVRPIRRPLVIEAELRTIPEPATCWRYAIRRLAEPLVLVAAIAACRDADDYPRGWTPLRAPVQEVGTEGDSTAPRLCPDLAGEYDLNEGVIYANLFAKFMTREQQAIDWTSAKITNVAGDSIHVELARNELRDTVRLSVGERFTCYKGWLSSDWPEYLLRERPDDGFDEDRGYLRTLWLARDEAGRLIGREEIVSYRVVYGRIRVPFARRDEVRWRRLSKPALVMEVEPEPEGDPAINVRLAREEAALEAGTPLPLR